ncbi:uncharacterized protein LOC128894082 [Hylaeus anthracinus]|uniref:uncharacterized protein LOC128894082 n=1 Tax=Hylaeus anthracinus TaxID=313031 RepID=UPI0023BA2B6F|nr:uncharacterized protein LOC128894082 [Hylaeus anthracinus]
MIYYFPKENMRRNPRAGSGLTKTQIMRQAKAAAVVQEFEKRHDADMKYQPDPLKTRKRILSYEPKKVDFKKPGMTKAMLARVKQAEKFKQDYERRQAAVGGDRVPRRTPAPIGGDSRSMLNEREFKFPLNLHNVHCYIRVKKISPRFPLPYKKSLLIRMGRERIPASRVKSRSPSASPPRAGPSQVRPKTPQKAISKKTNELARMLNADVIQAEPIGAGPISNIVIPPGTVNNERTTVVSVPHSAVQTESKITSEVANRSIQVISETLNEQEAVEVKVVNNRLTELQQARRDFVIAVANVGGNAVNIGDETPPAYLYRVHDIEDEYLKPKYGRDHPDILAAREFLGQKEAARRMEEEFERIAASEYMPDELQLDVPFEEELYQDKDISWEEDEEIGVPMPRPSRVKAYTAPVPQQQKSFQFKSFDPEELERFFDLERFPPCPICGPPPGREDLHPDLWELEDPWYKPPPQPDMPDLMEFDLMDFD